VTLTGSGAPEAGGALGAAIAGFGAVTATGAGAGGPGCDVVHPVEINATDATTDNGITSRLRAPMPPPPCFSAL
jgi:hypothetical protein